MENAVLIAGTQKLHLNYSINALLAVTFCIQKTINQVVVVDLFQVILGLVHVRVLNGVLFSS